MRKGALALAVIGITLVASTQPVWAAQKVTLTPTGTTLTETQTTAVQVQLDEPIIGPGPGSPYFNLNITSSDPSRVTIDPNPVEYDFSEWAQTKVFTVTANHDNAYNTSNSVTISFIVDSDSEYYDGFSGSFVLSIVDIDPAPAAAAQSPDITPAAAPVSTLAETGQNATWVKIIFIPVLLLAAMLLRKSMRSGA